MIFNYQDKAHPSVIKKLYILKIPSLPEQEKIANFLSSIDDKISELDAQIQIAKQWKAGLLQGLFI
jgi:type I restriction enzyme S subunit